MRIKTKEKTRKSILIEPKDWALIEEIVDTEDIYTNTVLNYLLKAGLEMYEDFGWKAITGEIDYKERTIIANDQPEPIDGFNNDDSYLYD